MKMTKKFNLEENDDMFDLISDESQLQMWVYFFSKFSQFSKLLILL